MTYSLPQLAQMQTALWFCVRTQPKHEYVAATALHRQLNVNCFAPRMRYRKMTRRGAVWFVEAMFPGYLFAEFIYSEQHRRVEYAPGIQGIVQFGDYIAAIDSETLGILQKQAGAEDIVTIDPDIEVGQSVRIAEGPLRGLEAVVTRVLPAKERIRVLLELLGGPIEAEVARPNVVPLGRPRFEAKTGNGSI
jgi:transcriptional antiterminator RfaH